MTSITNSKRKVILGCPIDALTMKDSLEQIESHIAGKKPVQHVVVNAAKIVALHKNKKLREIIFACPMINADGQSVVWASKILGKPLPERVAGIDLMLELIKLAAAKGYRVYFLGAKEEVIKKVTKIFSCQYPALKIAGYRNGYWNDEENEQVVNQIKNSGADILFVGISSPKKEYWLAENLCNIDLPFSMGVGGSFDVVAGLTKRAPLWMQKAGLEWFYRLCQEPGRMWKRYVFGNINFIWLVLKDLTGIKPDWKIK